MNRLIINLILILYSIGIYAQTAIAPSIGNGTSTDPYRITTLNNLYWITAPDAVVSSPTYAQRMGSHYAQMNDINATTTSTWFNGAGWLPIGTSSLPFVGRYDGQFYSIINLSINRPTTKGVGFIKQLGTFTSSHYKIIKNLTLENVNIVGMGTVGGLVGFALYRCIIENCHVSGNVSCVLPGNDLSNSANVGGLVGRHYLGRVRIAYCSSNCTVQGTAYVGGLIGHIDAYIDAMDGTYAVTNCFSTGSVNGNNQSVGGLIGYSKCIVRYSYSRSTVVGTDYNVGGLVGLENGAIWQCYSTGHVSGSPYPSTMGGLVGANYKSSRDLEDCYWDTQTSGQSSSAFGIGKTTSQMKTESTYDSWRLNNPNGWKPLSSSINNGYPALYPIEASAPVVVNLTPTNIRPNKAVYGGSISSTGNPNFIYQHGFCWSTSGSPTTSDNIYDMGTRFSAGDISYEVTGLQHNTTYYVRSFAQNAVGLVYGDEVSFTTLDGELPSGSGTTTSPYRIGTLSNLLWLCNAKEWDKHYIQTSDIDASATTTWNAGNGFVPIGNTLVAFTGSYDGNHDTIKGLFINRLAEDKVGMFGVANGGASFSNINIKNANITARDNTAILVGKLTDGSIDNCTTSGLVVGANYVGGMVSCNTNSTIENCENSGNVEGKIRVGGIAGENYGLIEKCKNTGNILSGVSEYHIGGIAGYQTGVSATISRCFNTGNISTGVETAEVGGILGYQFNGSFVDNCYNLGNVTGSTGGWSIGGLVGQTHTSTIINSYSIGLVSGSAPLEGGLIGGSISSTITGCFWNTETSQQATSQGGTGLTTEQMKNLSVYTDAGWTFVNDGKRAVGCTEDCWDMDLSEVIANGYPFLGSQTAELTWNGNTDNDWDKADNWTGSLGGPSEYKEITIPLTSNQPTITNPSDNPAKCVSLTIDENASLTIVPNGALTVEGAIDNSGTLLIQSSVAGSGSLLQNNDNVPATVEVFVSGSSRDRSVYKYHLSSIPLADNILASESFMGAYLWQFDATALAGEEWVSIQEPTTVLNVREGYLTYVAQTTHTYSFNGNLKNGSFTSDIASTLTGNYNLIPNPYPAAIDWDAVDLSGSNLETSIWFFNSQTGNYTAYNGGVPAGGNIIPIGQSIFVKASDDSPVLELDNSVCLHNDKAFYKNNNEVVKDIIQIKVSANTWSDEAYVRFRESASNNFESENDASKLKGFSGSPQLYTLSEDDRELSINTMVLSDGTLTIPLGFELDVVGEACLSFQYLDSFDPGIDIYLQDLQNNNFINLRETSAYCFNHILENEALRFVLHFGDITDITENSNQDLAKIWGYQDKILIDIPGEQGDMAIVKVVGILGNCLQESNIRLNSPSTIQCRQKGIVIVSVQTQSNQYTRKIFIK